MRKGSQMTEETKVKISVALSGRALPPEVCAKISEAKRAHNLSEETRSRIRQAKLGSKNPMFGRRHTDETKAKIREANLGRILSPEHRKKVSIACTGERNHHWKGGRRRDTQGYVYVYQPEHPRATKAGCVMEHRLVMEQELGRYLEPREIVHHKNGIKDDNRPENLIVYTKGKHIADHGKGYIDGYLKGHQDGTNARLSEIASKLQELHKENRLLRWHLFRQTTPSTD